MKKAAIGLALSILCMAQGQSPPRAPRFREVDISVGQGPRWISVADVNHDHNPDILVANADGGTLTVLLGDGNGQFHEAAGSPFAAGHLPNDIAIADMNGDGNLDLVVANHQSPYISIFLGDGKGGFRPAPGSPVDVHSKPHPHGVAVADFNGDGKPDVVTDSWGSNQIELLLGDGKGGLRLPGRYFNVGHRPYERLRSADFNHDGLPDVVTTNLDDGTATILLGDGKGGFREATGSPFPAGAKPWQVYVGDLDGGGNADLAIIPYQRDIAGPSEDVVTVLSGDGKGSFKPMPGTPLPLGDCRGPNSITAGDLAGNGTQTIAVACAESRNLMLFDRGAEGKFTSSSVPFKGGWGSVTAARLTSDNRSELITANPDDGTISIFFPR
ncbi:MAG: VCBS repeat-containing protein [Terracidiphilus sp.]